MLSRKNWVSALVFACLAVVLWSVPSLAGEKLAFGEKVVRNVPSGCSFVKCASVQITVPSDGFVVVTASGLASFSNNVSFLELTLSDDLPGEQPWLFRVTPGQRLFQTYCVRMVFPVSASNTYEFFLKGKLCKGRVGNASVETGSITAEFYADGDVQQSTLLNVQVEDASRGIQVNTP